VVGYRREWLKRLAVAGMAWLLPLFGVRDAHGQTLRAPDLGMWFTQTRGANGTNRLIVADLIGDGVFARAGLREGDQIVSIDGRPIDSEGKFVQAFFGNHTVNLVVARNERQLTFTLRATNVMDGMVAMDPFYQAGFIMGQRASDLTVEHVFPCTPAFYSGLRAGDVITRINDQPIALHADLTKILRQGGSVSLVVVRNGQNRPLIMSISADRSRRSALSVLGQGGSLIPGGVQPAPPIVPSVRTLSPPQLLAPPIIPSQPPAVPMAPPPIPALPPPGAVPTVPHS
jgi:membrane-associated protease RseP (regulator of RpoE activity)